MRDEYGERLRQEIFVMENIYEEKDNIYGRRPECSIQDKYEEESLE